MSNFDHRELFAELARQLGAPALALDARGACRVAIDGIAFDIEWEEPAREFCVSAELGALPASAGEVFLKRLHQANYASVLQGTGAVGLDANAGKIMFVERVATRGAEPAQFAEQMRSLVNRVEAWRGILASARFAEPGGAFDPNETQWMLKV